MSGADDRASYTVIPNMTRNNNGNLVLSTILFLATSIAFMNLESIQKDDSDTNEEKVVTVAPVPHAPFPWEPTVNDGKDAPSAQNDTAPPQKSLHSNKSQQEQLDFLASMTFAGGDLRAPSCPCCQ